jgi:tetratricopeptide (TPR) repeat protein
MSTRLKSRPATQTSRPTVSSTPAPSEQFKRAVKLHQQGDLLAAEILYDALLAKEPNNLHVTYLLGLLGSQTQRPELARNNIEAYLKKNPEDAQAIAILALAYFDLKDYVKARVLLEKSVAKRGDNPNLYYNLGKTYFELQLFGEAIGAYGRAIQLQPTYVDAYIGKSVAEKEARQYESAACTLEHAIMLEPYRAESHFFYGNVMRDMGDNQAAIDAFETALSIKPEYIDAAINCGTAFKEMDRLEEAFSHYNHALTLDPYHPEGNYNKALALLLDGQLSRGWALYEWRLRSSDAVKKFIRHEIVRKAPDWNGQPLNGHLLVMAEQGVGDQIFYAGMLGDLQPRVTSITVCIDARLIPLLQRSHPDIHLITPEQLADSDGYDAQIYIGSLGRLYRPDEQAFANVRSPYLSADPERTAQLRKKLKQDGRLLCGLSWRSKNADYGDQKSLSLDTLSQALCLPGFDYVDLQYGDTQEERLNFEAKTGVKIHKLEDIDNFSDIDALAALISACDIVVTVSNTTAHLAGALGKPTLVMLPQSSAVFWYWHRQSEQSPWYPTARLFRKDELGDWPSVIDAITLTLAGIA